MFLFGNQTPFSRKSYFALVFMVDNDLLFLRGLKGSLDGI